MKRANPVFCVVDYFNLLDDRRFDKQLTRQAAERNLEVLLSGLTRALSRELPRDTTSELNVRLYGGWTQLPTKVSTSETAALSPFARDLASALPRYRTFDPPFSVVPELALATCAVPNSQLIGTLRNDQSKRGQKMVDTAIAVDLVHLAFRAHEALVLVSNDDDFVPPCLAASRASRKLRVLHLPDPKRMGWNDHLLRKSGIEINGF